MMTRAHRIAAATIAAFGAIGLTACNSDSATTSASTTTQSSDSQTSAPSDNSSTSNSPSSDAQSSDSSTASSSEATSDTPSESASSADSGDGSATPPNAKLKMGDTATINDGDDTFKLTVKGIEEAPDSAYSAGGVSRSNGTMYFVRWKVEAVKTNPTYFGTNSVNGLFLRPAFQAPSTGKRLYGDVPSCKSEPKKLKPGESGEGCYIYQVTGDKVTTVAYDDISKYHLLWQ